MADIPLKTLQLISVRWWNASAYYAISLTEALTQAGIYSTAGGRPDSPPLLKAGELRLPTFTDINLETLNPLSILRSVGRVKRFVRQQHIPLINGHRAEDGLCAVLARQRSVSPLAVIRTVSDVRPPKNHPLNYWLHSRGMDFFIFSCRASLQRYQSVWPIFSGKSAVIYSAVDTEFFHPAAPEVNLRRRLGIADDEVVIGIIARLSPVKDHHTFLKAAALVHQQAPNTRFLICGEAAQISHAALQSLAQELGISRKVILLPRREDLAITDLIGCLDVGVVASNGSEVICRISEEYMAMGKPQVVTDVNVLPEIVTEGENGLVVPAGDSAAMANALLKLAANPQLRQRMGETARRLAETRYSYREFARQTAEVYREVLERVSRNR